MEKDIVTTVAFIGLGKMGLGMAQRLLNAGHDLRVYNRTRSKAADLASAGARVCDAPKEACNGAEAVIAMTADDVSSRSVWFGAKGVLASRLAPRALAIECSTLSYDWVMELANTAWARDLRYIDAPVTGLPEHAATGNLTSSSVLIPRTLQWPSRSLAQSHSASCDSVEWDPGQPTS